MLTQAFGGARKRERAEAPDSLARMDPATLRAAFFDLDRSLIPGSSLFLLARGLYDRDLLRVRDLLRFGWRQGMFRLRGEAGSDVETSRRTAFEFVAGRSRDELIAWGREIAAVKILPRVYPDIARIIDEHRTSGDATYLMTAAPSELATAIAEALGMTGAIGTRAEVSRAGDYTGRLVGEVMHGAEKAKAARAVAAERGLDLGASFAYSDSVSDLPLLESVGRPHAVNPESGLRKVAHARAWPVHELRPRRRLLLVGIPAGVGGASLFGAGMALGIAVERRRRPTRAGWATRAAGAGGAATRERLRRALSGP
ncbi:HAD-IB family hydrolase [soil metagenome]